MKDGEGKVFTGASLEKALKDKSLIRSGITLVGMVKSSEKKAHISFTRAGCDAWIDLPINLIEQAEQLGQLRCKDHIHPVFRITLKEAKSPEAKVLASLLAQPYQESTGPESGLGPVGGAEGSTYLARRRGPGEYGCCRWECIWWHYYECTGPDGRKTICARCRMYGCAEFGCEPGRDYIW